MKRLKAVRVRFAFQEIIAPYIADFVLIDKMVCVEIDGSVHQTSEARAYDYRRDAHFSRLGFRVIRIPNDVIENYPVEDLYYLPDSTIKGSFQKFITHWNKKWNGRMTVESRFVL